MSSKIDCVALVTARGGSKRVPGKNTRLLAGKPLIAWSVEAGLRAQAIRRVIVSTDNDDIAQAARKAGGEVPFLRPAELAGDLSSHYGVIAHALDWLERDEARLPEFLCLLQPTSPLRTSADIDAIVKLAVDTGADSAFAVTRVATHPAYMYRIGKNSAAEPYLPLQPGYVRSQDLEPLYYVNGAAYVLRPATFRNRSAALSENPVAYIMPPERSVDIDEEHDFILAESLAGGR
jgi:CMP-N-acetylneuraminic acid synthetase